MDDYCNLVPTYEDKLLAFSLVNAMTPIYNAEKARQKAITKVLNDSGIYMKATKIDDYITDGDVSYKILKYLIAELKNDIGSKGAEPYMQGCLYYLELTRREATKHPSSSLPCLLMLIFGMMGLFNHICSHILFQVLTLLSQAQYGQTDPTCRCSRLPFHVTTTRTIS